MGIFFALSTCIVLAVGTTLAWPGSALESIWTVYPERRAMLMPYREFLGPFFLSLAVEFVFASVGCFTHRRWGWWLAVLVFIANGVGDLVQLAMGKVLEGSIGVAAAGAILFYLSRPGVRAAFT